MSAWLGKKCARCDGKKGRAYARRKLCGNCTAKARKAGREAQWAARIRQLYNLSAADYWRLYEAQGGRCFLCLRATGQTKKLAVDHDHVTGAVRGLLCGTCNKIVGHARDDAGFFARGHEYLTNPPWRRLQETGTHEQEAA